MSHLFIERFRWIQYDASLFSLLENMLNSSLYKYRIGESNDHQE